MDKDDSTERAVSEATNAQAQRQYRKKPVVIEASQWFRLGDHPAVVSREAENPNDPTSCHVPEGCGWVPTLEGGHIVTPGDWIITGVRGEHYPCKPDIFAATYDAALGATCPAAHVAPETDQQNHPAQTAGQPAPQADPQRLIDRAWQAAQAAQPAAPAELDELMAAIDTFGKRPDNLNRRAIESILRSALSEAAQAGAVQPAAPTDDIMDELWKAAAGGPQITGPRYRRFGRLVALVLGPKLRGAVQPAADALTDALLSEIWLGLAGKCSYAEIRYVIERANRGTAPKAAEPFRIECRVAHVANDDPIVWPLSKEDTTP